MVHGAAWKPGGDVGTDPRMAPAQRWGQAGPSSPESGDSRSVSDGATRQPLSQPAGIRLDKSRFSQARECGRRLTWEVIMMLESIKKLMAKPREAHAQLSTPQRSRLLRTCPLAVLGGLRPSHPGWPGARLRHQNAPQSTNQRSHSPFAQQVRVGRVGSRWVDFKAQSRCVFLIGRRR